MGFVLHRTCLLTNSRSATPPIVAERERESRVKIRSEKKAERESNMRKHSTRGEQSVRARKQSTPPSPADCLEVGITGLAHFARTCHPGFATTAQQQENRTISAELACT